MIGRGRNGFLLGRDKIDPTGQDREFRTFGKGMDFEDGAPNTATPKEVKTSKFDVFEFLHVHHEASDFEIEEQVG